VPDVVDVSLDVAAGLAAQGLFQAYQSQFWDDVPDALKDPSGLWCATYYGVMTFAVNADVVKSPPKTWPELRNATYKSPVCPPCRPTAIDDVSVRGHRCSTCQRWVANDDAGLRFFAELNQQGSSIIKWAVAAALLIGETPIVPMWSYIAFAIQASSANNPQITVVVPGTSGRCSICTCH
jgi:putative spermidine/putrescine transport system substrate-binding protein